MTYSLPARREPELEANLKCLHDCVQTDPVFRRDLKTLAKLRNTCRNAPSGALLKASR